MKMNTVRGLVVISDQNVYSAQGDGDLLQLVRVVGAAGGQLAEYLSMYHRYRTHYCIGTHNGYRY